MPFTAEQSQALLLIARRAVEAAVCGREPPAVVTSDAALDAMTHGVFVTIKTHGRLRGCIGRFAGDQPLPQLVAMMAVAAATQDPRFTQNRLKPEELCDCHIDISVLSPMERIANPLDFQLGVHGIQIRSGTRFGCFLPQVGPEAGWSAEELLRQCCARKAGLDPDAWRNGQVEVYRFTTEMIEEPHVSEQTPQVRDFAPVVVQATSC
jgi:AmmeMemoRadiSam system protein A